MTGYTAKYHLIWVSICVLADVILMSEPTTTGSQQKVCKTDHCNHHDHSVTTNVEPTTQIHHASCIEGIRREILSKDNLFESAHFDASGHIGSGVGVGNRAWLGHYQQCTSLPDSRYCLVDLTLTSTVPHRNESSLLVRWGLCAVSNCTNDGISSHIKEIVNGTFMLPWMSVNSSDVHCGEKIPYTTGYYATIGILLGLTFLVVTGTVVDIAHAYEVSHRPVRLLHKSDSEGSHIINANDDFSSGVDSLIEADGSGQPDDRPPWERPPKRSQLKNVLRNDPGCTVQFFLCFSIISNLKMVLNTQSSERSITCLHGIRVISMLWIILGHTFLAVMGHNILDNPVYAVNYTQRFTFQPIGNAYFAVDTFFFLSGLLVAYLSLHEMDKASGRLPLIKFYLHRYLRLTPNMAMVLLFWMFVIPHLSEGPIWYQMQDRSTCHKYWWTNLLYILNFYPTNPNDQCIGWTWYLAVDMQLYLISPVILYTLYKSKKLGLTLALSLLVTSLIVTAILITMFNIDINLTYLVITGQESKALLYESIIFMKPYCRLVPHVLGILLGYIMHRQKKKPSTIPLFDFFQFPALGMWFFCIGLGMANVYGLFQTFTGHPLDDISNTVYGTFSHLVWGIVLVWMVYACHYQQGGPVNTVLSWKVWAPLSRLTYSVYLLHPVVMFTYFGSQQAPMHVTDSVMAFYYMACVVLSYFLAVLLMLLVELPLNNLEKLSIGNIHQTELMAINHGWNDPQYTYVESNK